MNLFEWYRSLAERERRAVLYGGTAAAVLLLVGGLWKLEAATESLAAKVDTKRADLAWMQAAAPRLQAMPAIDPSESLPLALNRTARDAGLAEMKLTAPPGDNGARVRLEGASFDAMVIWLARLQQERGLAVQFATIDKAGAEGLVDADVELRGS